MHDSTDGPRPSPARSAEPHQLSSVFILALVGSFFLHAVPSHKTCMQATGTFIPDGEHIVLRCIRSDTSSPPLDTLTTAHIIFNRRPALHFRSSDGTGHSEFWLTQSDLSLIRYVEYSMEGRPVLEIDCEGDIVHIRDDATGVDKHLRCSEPVHVSTTILQVLRRLAATPGLVDWKGILLVRHGRDYRSVPVYARVLEEKMISVPAGRFRCREIEFGVQGLIGNVFWPTRYRYDYTADPPHHFVRYFDPDGEVIELVSYGK